MLAQGTMLRNGNYRIERQLASGGFGNTYIVRNLAFEEVQAMKFFFMRVVNTREGETVTVSISDSQNSFNSQKEKFKKEAQRLRKLSNTHIVRVHDMFEENGTAYYIMDYVEGKSLNEHLKEHPWPLSEIEINKILPQVLDALKCVHAQKIWHLDIKPGNIMYDCMGKAYLIDFGASKQISHDGGQTSTTQCYTPGYAPMEQVEQATEKYGPWTDIYALGATLYNLLTKQQPPSSTDIAEHGDSVFIYPQGVSQQMQKMISWMMKPQRSQRPQSIQEIEQHLANMVPMPSQQESATSLKEATVISSQKTSKKKKLLPFVLSLLLLILLGIGVFWFIHSSKNTTLYDDDDETEIVEEKNYRMHGYVGNYPVTMMLEITGSVVGGSYYYDRQGSKNILLLTGTIENGAIDLNETTVDGMPTGHFKGKLSKGIFIGDFFNSKGDKMSFRISER